MISEQFLSELVEMVSDEAEAGASSEELALALRTRAGETQIKDGKPNLAPPAFEDWTLMDSDSLPTFWSECGSVTIGASEWTIGRSETSLGLYLFTDLPHPDNLTGRGRNTATYIMDGAVLFTRLCDMLTKNIHYLPDPEEADDG